MSADWWEGPLGALAPFQYGKNLPERDRQPGSVPVFSSAGLTGRHNEALVNGRGLVIGRKGTVGKVYFASQPFWPIDTTFYIAEEPDKFDMQFLYYLLQTIGLEAMNSDSAVPGLNRDNAHRLIVKTPPLPEQRTIAHILGTLDDKIELNRKMNETLEAMARALFKSWFVDFDPVRRNMARAGASTGSISRASTSSASEKTPVVELGETTAFDHLFPSEFDPSTSSGSCSRPSVTEPGAPSLSRRVEVPKGWRVGKLGDAYAVQGGYAFKSADFKDSGAPVIKIKNINADRTIDMSDVDHISETVAEKAGAFKLSDGDLLMAMTGATIGKYGLILHSGSANAYLNQRVARLIPRAERRPWFGYSALLATSIYDYVVSTGEGSAQPNISGTQIENAPLLMPDSSLVRAFSQIVDPFIQKLLQNRKFSSNLTKCRDTLLPKLISGELRVRDASKFVEAAL